MVQLNEEQMKALQDRIKNMSPEELKEFQKQQCIFCQIISGKVASKKVYEDEKCIGILDINPANPGHVLLLPKEHYVIMPQIPEEDLSALFIAAKKVSHAALKALKAEGTNIFIANGLVAGQKAQHFMIHIIPRKEGDDIDFAVPENNIAEGSLDIVISRLAPKINKVFGIEGEEEEVIEEKPKEEKKKEIKTEQQKKPAVLNAEFKEEIKKPEVKKEEVMEERKEIKKPAKEDKKPKDKGAKKTSLDDIADILGK